MEIIFKKIYNRASSYLDSRIIFLMDLALSLLSSVLSIFVTVMLTGTTFFESRLQTASFIAMSLVFTALMTFITRTHTIIIRHATIKETWRFALAALGKICMTFGAMIIFFPLCDGLTGACLTDFFMTMFMMMGTRVLMVMAYEVLKTRVNDRTECRRVLVYGTDDKSVSLIKRLQASPHYRVIGFCSFGEIKVSHTIDGLNVHYFASEDDVRSLQYDKDVDAILFIGEDDLRVEQDRLVQYSINLGIRILMAPQIDEVKDGKVEHPIRKIEIEDLLGRPEIKISLDEIIAGFKDKTIMVTGAAGSIGSELCRQLAGFGVGRLVLFDNAETPMHNLRLEMEAKFPGLDFVPVIGDVRHPKRLDFAFRKFHPQVVFHAAAYKHVPLMEENPCEAVLVNVAGSRNVADKCIEYDVEKMVMISTDKAVNPTNIMGCTKRLAEIYVQSLGLAVEAGNGTLAMPDGSTRSARTKFVTTRFGNVLGSNGSVIPLFREQIAAGGPVTVTHPEINRFFMTIPEACRLVMEAATMSTGNQIFVFDMGKSIKIDTLARKMIQLAGFVPDKDIKIEYTGLRPGEKLYEEVLASSENTMPTDHTRIRVARVRTYDYFEARATTDKLEELSRAVNIPDMVRLMKATVPEFKSKNSPYEVYDVQDPEDAQNL